MRDATELETVRVAQAEAADAIGLHDDLRRLLAGSHREVTAQVPVRMDDGRLRVLTAHRVQHNGARGPYKGGLRYHPDVDLDGVRALADRHDVEDRAGRPAVRRRQGRDRPRSQGASRPPSASAPRARSWTASRRSSARCGTSWPRTWAPARPRWPGSWTSTAACTATRPPSSPASPSSWGARWDGCEATGRGVAIVAREAARAAGLDLTGARVAVQGFGNVGSHAAEALRAAGLPGGRRRRPRPGAVRNPAGLDVDELLRRARTGITGHDGMDVERIDNAELLATECEILVPAAVGGVLHEGNADRVRARMVVEAANAPAHAGRRPRAGRAGSIVVPDVLANAGGVIVSYLEWVQNLQNVRWDRAQVDAELSRRLVAAHRGGSAPRSTPAPCGRPPTGWPCRGWPRPSACAVPPDPAVSAGGRTPGAPSWTRGRCPPGVMARVLRLPRGRRVHGREHGEVPARGEGAGERRRAGPAGEALGGGVRPGACAPPARAGAHAGVHQGRRG